MQISIFVKEDQLAELANFLSAEIPYEHAIRFSLRSEPYFANVHLYYNDYAALVDWRMEHKEKSLFEEQS